MTTEKNEVLQGELNRSLKARHIQMIAIGGAIGTGLFLASGYTIHTAGPGGALLAYGIMGVMVYFLMTSLGEMATYMPVSGSFQTYCNKFVDPALGFAVGWLYWLNWALTLSVELVAAEIIMRFWFPDIPGWIWVIVFTAVLYLLNAISVKGYGETEFWFAGIKVVAIIIFIILGALMILGFLGGNEAYGVKNFMDGNAFPNGGWAVVVVMFSAAFSFAGTETVGMAAGESENPEKNIPKAINKVFWRILIFYLGAIFVIGCIIPWQTASIEVSPFTVVFQNSGIPGFSTFAATIMNIVVLTSVLSAANSGLYVGSRMLWAMAREGEAPRILGTVSKKKVPIAALTFTIAFGLLALTTSVWAEETVYVALVSAVGVSTLVGWLAISVSHMRFRKWYRLKGLPFEDLKYKALLFPAGPIISIVLCAVVLIGQAFDRVAALSLLYGVPLFLILYFYYKIRFKTKVVNLEDVNVDNLRLSSREREEWIESED
ncbi:MAG TPA: amino acid permease [Clostridiaceae bacterium]|nr:amino acid permease [Clostridiaceae bacterium]